MDYLATKFFLAISVVSLVGQEKSIAELRAGTTLRNQLGTVGTSPKSKKNTAQITPSLITKTYPSTLAFVHETGIRYPHEKPTTTLPEILYQFIKHIAYSPAIHCWWKLSPHLKLHDCARHNLVGGFSPLWVSWDDYSILFPVNMEK